MKDSNAAKNKASNTTATENPPKIKNEEKPNRIMKISEFLKAKKNANIDIDLSSVSKKTYSTLIDDSSKKKNLEKKKEEEKNISGNEIQEKEGSKIPQFRRKRKYRLRTNEVKLPSDITLLQRLCEDYAKTKKLKMKKMKKKKKRLPNLYLNLKRMKILIIIILITIMTIVISIIIASILITIIMRQNLIKRKKINLIEKLIFEVAQDCKLMRME